MGSNTKELFKDRITKTNRLALAEKLLGAIDEGEDAVKSLLFEDFELELYSDHGTYQEGMHRYCGGLRTAKVTEKRICKCLYYWNGPHDAPQKCQKCSYKNRFDLVGDYKIIDYEVPAFYYVSKTGNIDLIISDGTTKYATEVKPYRMDQMAIAEMEPHRGNPETLLRMIAEIMTYTMGYPEGQYQKAIAFFEGTSQAEEFSKIDAGTKKILEKVDIAVFCFKRVNERTYELCRLKSSADQIKSAGT